MSELIRATNHEVVEDISRAGSGVRLGAGLLLHLLEREQDFNRGVLETGDSKIHGGPVASLQGVPEAFVRCHQHQLAVVLSADLQGLDPGAELLGIHSILEFLLKS